MALTKCIIYFYTFKLIVSNFHCLAQNLVKNPSFELYQTCPSLGNFNNWGVKNWWGFDSSRVVYFNNCANYQGQMGSGVPKNWLGFQQPKGGHAYAAINVLNLGVSPINNRSYIQGEFQNELVKDSFYCVNYWLALTYGSKGIKNVEAYINKTKLNWDSPSNFHQVLSGIIPQIKSETFLTDTLNWMLVSGIYKATGGEKYITIGNFLNDERTSILPNGNYELNSVVYFIDDVSVTQISITPPSLGRDTILCKAQLPIKLNAPFGFDSLKWNTNETTNFINVFKKGIFWLKCSINGCGSISDTIQIKTFDIPDLKLAEDTLLCKGNSIMVGSDDIYNSYHWNTGQNTSKILLNKGGLYILEIQSSCDTQRDSINISYDSLPDEYITLGPDADICNERVKTGLIVKSNNNRLPNYKWNTGDTASEIKVNKGGSFYFKTVFKCGILYSDTIRVLECGEDTTQAIYFPNTFTPNDDGLNDRWFPVSSNYEIWSLIIFDRWGKIIFNGSNINGNAWDGKFEEIPCQDGIYTFLVSYRSRTNLSAELRHRNGLINLMK